MHAYFLLFQYGYVQSGRDVKVELCQGNVPPEHLGKHGRVTFKFNKSKISNLVKRIRLQ